MLIKEEAIGMAEATKEILEGSEFKFTNFSLGWNLSSYNIYKKMIGEELSVAELEEIIEKIKSEGRML